MNYLDRLGLFFLGLVGVSIGCAVLLLLLSALAGEALNVKIMFEWYDCWVGVYWDRKRECLYVFPLPMIGARLSFTERAATRNAGEG